MNGLFCAGERYSKLCTVSISDVVGGIIEFQTVVDAQFIPDFDALCYFGSLRHEWEGESRA